jgi:hypothetical protein
MRALVVFESMFGNTQVIAEAIADGLSGRMQVDLVEVGAAPAEVGDEVALSRPGTRQDAAKQASDGLVSTRIGLREWLARPQRRTGVAAAAFDTRVSRPRLPGSAARAAEKRLRQLGFRVVAPAASFYVEGTLGPLLEGEPERARRWGEQVLAHTGVEPAR